MGTQTAALWQLAFELLDYPTLQRLRTVATACRFDIHALTDLDRKIGGPGIYNINEMNDGYYEGADREIFRPLQTCYGYFQTDNLSLRVLAGDVVRMMSLHIDTLIKQASGRWASWLPLGQTFRYEMVKERLDTLTWDQLLRFTTCCTESRPMFLRQANEASYSVEDAVVAYVVGRKLAEALYPLVDLHTPVRKFYANRKQLTACV